MNSLSGVSAISKIPSDNRIMVIKLTSENTFKRESLKVNIAREMKEEYGCACKFPCEDCPLYALHMEGIVKEELPDAIAEAQAQAEDAEGLDIVLPTNVLHFASKSDGMDFGEGLVEMLNAYGVKMVPPTVH